jgi:hypothetical protein
MSDGNETPEFKQREDVEDRDECREAHYKAHKK